MSGLYSYVMLALIVLPFYLIGFVSGMLFMRSGYLRLLRQARTENRRMQRTLERERGRA